MFHILEFTGIKFEMAYVLSERVHAYR